MNILLTGYAGFIGYHLSKKLIDLGHTIIGIDNFNDYYDVRLKSYRDSKLPKFIRLKTDISNYDNVSEVFEHYKIDSVINLAAYANVFYSVEHPKFYQDSNINGFFNIIENCRLHKIKRIIYASSSSVYGGIMEYPWREDMNVNYPMSMYACSKRCNELVAHDYSQLYDIETIGLRFFTVVGPMGRPDMAMWLFADAISNHKPVKIFNYGKMDRDFTYVEDIVEGIVSCTTTDLKNKCEIYNLGNNKPENILKVVDLIEENLGVKAIKDFQPLRKGEVLKTYADITKAQKDLGFEPKTNIEGSVAKFIDWYKNEWKILT
jgi:UDP-glucuronate 4-epimerase